MSTRYPLQFIEVKYPLSELDVEKAYNILTQLTFSSDSFPTEKIVEDLNEKQRALERKNCLFR